MCNVMEKLDLSIVVPLYNEAEFKKGNDTRLEAALDLIDSLTR